MKISIKRNFCDIFDVVVIVYMRREHNGRIAGVEAWAPEEDQVTRQVKWSARIGH
jgi:hypothetical protein